jgi:tetratricopeptide (TPR) repeat protein
MKISRRQLTGRAFALFAFYSCICAFLYSQDVKDYNVFTEAEIRSLPYPIQIKLRYHLGGSQDPELGKIIDKYIKVYGVGFNTLHHYGKGLIYLQRYRKGAYTSEINRTFILGVTVNELSFILDPKNHFESQPNFRSVYLYKIYCARGDTYFALGKLPQAANDYISSIKIESSYSPAYLGLSECYRKLGNLAEADKILQILASHVSKSK